MTVNGTRQPTISVLIPAYQAARFVGTAIESALAQQPTPHEVLVCDDGSTDDTLAVIRRYQPQVIALSQPNGGEASARNALWRAAKGDYVAYLDADDIYLPGRLEAVLRLLADDPSLDIVTTDAYLMLEGQPVGRRYEGEQRFAETDQRKAILRGNFIFGHAIVRRSLLESVDGFDEDIRYATDWETWIRLILAGGKAALVPEPLAEYRLHATAMSVQRLRMSDGRVQTLAKTLDRSDLHDDERDILQRSLAAERVRNDREHFLAGLSDGTASRRDLARRIARSREQPRRVRLLAAVAALSPRGARMLNRRSGRSVVRGPGDRPIPRHAAPGPRA